MLLKLLHLTTRGLTLAFPSRIDIEKIFWMQASSRLTEGTLVGGHHRSSVNDPGLTTELRRRTSSSSFQMAWRALPTNHKPQRVRPGVDRTSTLETESK